MQACELVELAGLVSTHGASLVECSRPISMTALESYWSASKCRLDRWGRELKQHESRAVAGCPQQRAGSPAGIIEEIFSGEVLARVWAAVLSAHDRRHGMEDAEIVSRSVLLSHLESRNRALKLLLDSTALNHREAVRLNRLRRTTERWADMLLGHLPDAKHLAEFAVEPARAMEFSADFRHHAGAGNRGAAWALLQLSLREAFRRSLTVISPNADLHARIATSVVSCFPEELFDSTGLMKSLWLSRLTHGANDAQGMIDELFAEVSPPETPDASFLRTPVTPTKRFDRGHQF